MAAWGIASILSVLLLMQALSRWLLEPDGGSLLSPPLIEVVEAGDTGQRFVVDYAGAYGEDGHRAPAHELWCLVLGVQGEHGQFRLKCACFRVLRSVLA